MHSSGGLGAHPDSSYSNVNTAYSSTAHLTSNQGHYNSHDRHDQDVFSDQNAIPLQNQSKMGGASQTQYNADPERLGQGAEKRRQQKKKGWFSGRVSWVVYILTIVQVGVFVGELIKNGMSAASMLEYISHLGQD